MTEQDSVQVRDSSSQNAVSVANGDGGTSLEVPAKKLCSISMPNFNKIPEALMEIPTKKHPSIHPNILQQDNFTCWVLLP
ncbi:hypothetical protein RR46_11447 [Papilio xuthus]|uniref:Uncharacterized protein n=1 Tax=Papilio xuthus TaxID=66420 RepID=A0A194PSJ8_PAPXU|nr:hypothetical protein RR46_11447 [Papilio xuthus]